MREEHAPAFNESECEKCSSETAHTCVRVTTRRTKARLVAGVAAISASSSISAVSCAGSCGCTPLWRICCAAFCCAASAREGDIGADDARAREALANNEGSGMTASSARRNAKRAAVIHALLSPSGGAVSVVARGTRRANASLSSRTSCARTEAGSSGVSSSPFWSGGRATVPASTSTRIFALRQPKYRQRC